MERPLNEHELNYILYHLKMVMDIDAIDIAYCYSEGSKMKNSIVFRPHSKGLTISYLDDLPILFSSNKDAAYSIDENENLIFNHDLLKSAFYLLSGYHEHFENSERDHWGRVKYNSSIQSQLEIIRRPIVNEYFDLIFEGINTLLLKQGRKAMVKKKLFNSFGFLLSHDIDLIDKYGWPHLGFKIKELLGLSKSTYSKWRIFKATIESLFQFVNPWRSNPYWNFEYLLKQEQLNNIGASYYFLDMDKIGGSKYTFDESRMLNLYQQLKEANHEIGIHGTNKSFKNKKNLVEEIRRLEAASNIKVEGGRQHRLWIDLSLTFKIHQEAGLCYDSSYGFAEHEGFRNSFCLPFKPYDFKEQRALEVWQFPLISMDTTLYGYRKLNSGQVVDSITTILKEVEKHNGIFTLLWHNSFFDETLNPGVTCTYEQILKLISNMKAESYTGSGLIKHLKNNEVNSNN
ncbi:polysaccharide deacetylase family protein [Ekhidna sp.]